MRGRKGIAALGLFAMICGGILLLVTFLPGAGAEGTGAEPTEAEQKALQREKMERDVRALTERARASAAKTQQALAAGNNGAAGGHISDVVNDLAKLRQKLDALDRLESKPSAVSRRQRTHSTQGAE